MVYAKTQESEERVAMGRIAVVNFVSIDGVIQSPLSADEDRTEGFAHGGWVPPYSDDTVGEFMRSSTVDAAGMLLGRRTHQILAQAWSQADEDEPAVAAMNRMTKHVVSRTLAEDDLGWTNSHLIDHDMPAAVSSLKQRTDGDLVVFGSGELVQALAEHDLVDQYRLVLFPVILGPGKRMFGERSPLSHFDLTDASSSASGVVMLTYTRGKD